MGPLPRGGALAARALAAALSGAALSACGSSVADLDRPPPTRAADAPSAFCVAARADAEAIRPLNALLSRGPVPAAELATTTDAVRRAGADLVAASPSEIRADVERTVQGVELQLDALAAKGGDPRAVAADPELTARLTAPELAEAGRRVNGYITRTCGTPTIPAG